MKVLGTLVGLVVSFSLLLAIVAGCYLLFSYSVGKLCMLEPQLATLIVIVSIIAIICCSIIAGGLKTVKQQTVTSTVFNIKGDIYKQLLSLSVSQIKHPQELQAGSGKESDFAELERLLALYGSPKVISAYLKLCKSAEKENQDERELSVLLIKLANEVRSDLDSPAMIFKENDLADLLLRRY